MGIWRLAGAFAVAQRQIECGRKTCQLHISQPVNIGVCYGFGCSFPHTHFQNMSTNN